MFSLEVLEEHFKKIKSLYPGLSFNRLLEDCKRFLYLNSLNTPSSSSLVFKNFLMRTSKGEPLQYILKESYFWNSLFYVDKRVLIPRNETEGLLELLLNLNLPIKAKVLEVGVGSGAIFLSFLKEVKGEVSFLGTDISREALEVSQKNLELHKNSLSSKHRVDLKYSDRLKDINQSNFDLIYSNPPYIKDSQKIGVHKQVDSFEPKVALYLRDSEHDLWFSYFFKEVFHALKSKGRFLMEGHEDNLFDLKTILIELGFESVEVKKDLTGRKRYLIAQKA